MHSSGFTALRFQAGGVSTFLRLMVSADAISHSGDTTKPASLILAGLETRKAVIFLLSSHVHVNIHGAVGQNTSDAHVEPGYLQPSGVYFCVVFGSWAVFLSLHLDPCVQFHAHGRARKAVIFSKDSDFYALLALSTLWLFCMGPRWGLNV